MSYVMMIAPVHLHQGCPLDYIGKRVTFVRYAEVLVGPLDPMGRRPGRYTDRDNMIVRYSEGELRVPVKEVRFVDMYPKPPAAHIPNGFSQVDRLGDLPDQIVFWPGDKIRSVGERHPLHCVVTEVCLSIDEKPRYEVGGSECAQLHYRMYVPENHQVVCRGNVYKLYHDEPLSFASDEEELAFWTREGISVCGLGRQGSGQPLWPCADFFRKGYVDLIAQTTPNGVWYRTYKLHDIFAGHRKHVRAFTERLYGARMDAEIAYVAEEARRREPSSSV